MRSPSHDFRESERKTRFSAGRSGRLSSATSGTYNPMGPYSQAHWIVRTTRPDPFDGFGQYVYTRYFQLGGYEIYDDNGHITQLVDSLGRFWIGGPGVGVVLALNFTYTGNHVTSVSGPASTPIATYTYMGDLLTTVTYADGSGYTYGYDNNNRLA